VNQQRTGVVDCGLRIADCGFEDSRLIGHQRLGDFPFRLSIGSKHPQSAIRNPQSIAPLTGAELASFNNEHSSNRERSEEYETNVAKG
jgi:hypothetical protein